MKEGRKHLSGVLRCALCWLLRAIPFPTDVNFP